MGRCDIRGLSLGLKYVNPRAIFSPAETGLSQVKRLVRLLIVSTTNNKEFSEFSECSEFRQLLRI